MQTTKTFFKDIDEYISGFPKETQILLEQMRTTIQKAASKATEAISYQIPTFKLNGNLVHFAGYKSHIGFYPGAGAIKIFEKEIAGYKSAKGSVQFPIEKSLPLALVKKIVQFRVKQSQEKAAAKKSK